MGKKFNEEKRNDSLVCHCFYNALDEVIQKFY